MRITETIAIDAAPDDVHAYVALLARLMRWECMNHAIARAQPNVAKLDGIPTDRLPGLRP